MRNVERLGVRSVHFARPEGHGWVERFRAEPPGPPEPHVGVCLHYDGSASDTGAMAWFRDGRAWKVGYSFLVLDDGALVDFQVYNKWVYHAGVCRPSAGLREHGAVYRNANRALVGIAIAARPPDKATWTQEMTVAALCGDVFGREGWPLEETWRITGHGDEAWPRGRKIDPTGPDPRNPVLSVSKVRDLMCFVCKT